MCIRDRYVRAAEALAAGALVGIPTETVYGLGADALNPEAVARVFEAKGRPSSVSYTHLDVYKRQLLLTVDVLGKCRVSLYSVRRGRIAVY